MAESMRNREERRRRGEQEGAAYTDSAVKCMQVGVGGWGVWRGVGVGGLGK